MSLDGLFKARMKSTQMWRRYLSPLAPTVHVQRGKWGLATPTRMLILFSEAEAALPLQSICMYYTLPYASTRRLASQVSQCDSSPGRSAYADSASGCLGCPRGTADGHGI